MKNMKFFILSAGNFAEMYFFISLYVWCFSIFFVRSYQFENFLNGYPKVNLPATQQPVIINPSNDLDYRNNYVKLCKNNIQTANAQDVIKQYFQNYIQNPGSLNTNNILRYQDLIELFKSLLNASGHRELVQQYLSTIYKYVKPNLRLELKINLLNALRNVKDTSDYSAVFLFNELKDYFVFNEPVISNAQMPIQRNNMQFDLNNFNDFNHPPIGAIRKINVEEEETPDAGKTILDEIAEIIANYGLYENSGEADSMEDSVKKVEGRRKFLGNANVDVNSFNNHIQTLRDWLIEPYDPILKMEMLKTWMQPSFQVDSNDLPPVQVLLKSFYEVIIRKDLCVDSNIILLNIVKFLLNKMLLKFNVTLDVLLQ